MRIDNSFYVGSISQSMLASVVFMLEEAGTGIEKKEHVR
jgi:hypothetical protein